MLLASSRPRRPGAALEVCDLLATPGGAEAYVASCAPSVTHPLDALPHVLVGSLAPAADGAK